MKRTSKLIIIFFILPLSLFAKDTLTVALGYNGRSIDPHKHTDSSTLAITKQVYENLFILDHNGNIQNELVESWSISSDNILSLKIKKGISLHNNEELQGKNVADSLQRNLDTPITKVLVENIDSIQVAGRYTIDIKVRSNHLILMHNLTHSSTSIVVEEEDKLLGTGPYILKDWKDGDVVTLEVFDNYSSGDPQIEEIIFRTIPEAANRYIALEINEVDIAYDIAPIDLISLEKNKSLKLVSQPSLGTDFLGFNTSKGALKDKRLRKAISLALDRDGILEALFEGRGEVADSLLAPSVYGHNQDYTTNYDIKEARDIMKGFEDNITLDLWIYEDTSKYQMAQIIQSNLKEIGIDVIIKQVELSTFLQETARGKHNMLIGLWYASTGDADYGFYPLLHSTSLGAVGNRSFYNNPQMDEALDMARNIGDPQVRISNYKKVHKTIDEEVPLFPIVYKQYNIGLNNSVRGFQFRANGNHVLKDISFN